MQQPVFSADMIPDTIAFATPIGAAGSTSRVLVRNNAQIVPLAAGAMHSVALKEDTECLWLTKNERLNSLAVAGYITNWNQSPLYAAGETTDGSYISTNNAALAASVGIATDTSSTGANDDD